jgi:methyl-accepting chemotaxis protein
MTCAACDKDIAELQKAIWAERTALLNGDLEHITAIADRKEHLIGRINANPPATSEQIEKLHNDLSRNQTLLRQAMHGVRSIADRLKDLQQIRTSLGTYDSHGNKAGAIAHTSVSLEKRT